MLKAVGLALRRVPEMNASLDDESVVLHDDRPRRPRHRDRRRAWSCRWFATATASRSARSWRRCAGWSSARARGKFAADDLRGGTFTVSNLGMYPVSHFAAVVNPPQAAILAVGAVRAVPVVRDGEVVPGHVMT